MVWGWAGGCIRGRNLDLSSVGGGRRTAPSQALVLLGDRSDRPGSLAPSVTQVCAARVNGSTLMVRALFCMRLTPQHRKGAPRLLGGKRAWGREAWDEAGAGTPEADAGRERAGESVPSVSSLLADGDCGGSSPDLKQLHGGEEEGDWPRQGGPRGEQFCGREPEPGSGRVRWEML